MEPIPIVDIPYRYMMIYDIPTMCSYKLLTPLSNSHRFCVHLARSWPAGEHATSHASTPLLEMYSMVYAPDETPLRGLPDQIRGCRGGCGGPSVDGFDGDVLVVFTAI